ncbi:putative acetyltransferase [Desulfosporosinus acididurans]|uniref:Putative acetyltransferase n=1 Tax=Desulfosporosinus acididurans TaxID=476652 RepID=A0A0J1FTW9_9FIRM|nr:GNAT family N-acetyltransferase [Desulfosporosinus acididurans]KLU66900.1 putative acetyltransferase [Desulfosporosinus acididurans]
MLNKEPHYSSEIEVEPLSPYHIPEVAQLYEEVFGDHFLGHMGQRFLRPFCAQFMNSPTNYGYVAKNKGRIVGFVFGTINGRPFSQFYRQNFWKLVVLVLLRYARDDYVRKHIRDRMNYVSEAFKSLFCLQAKDSQIPSERSLFASARILAIGVAPNFRGLGIANQLTGHFCSQMKQEGFKKVGLSTLPWNDRAIRFYKKDGWIVEESTDSSVSFLRSIG